jgi:hypothetical protein
MLFLQPGALGFTHFKSMHYALYKTMKMNGEANLGRWGTYTQMPSLSWLFIARQMILEDF